jgi:alanine-glyoxylate transaminase/serine-glyoxylate transaminase/serine-pyruvate transaminase
MFRIGHLGDVNESAMIAALGTTEMAMSLAGIPFTKGGVQAAIDYFVSQRGAASKQAAE